MTTTRPDDAFYIIKVILARLLSTGAAPVVERTAAALRDVIERDYAGVLRHRMDEVYRSAGAVRGDKAERESRVAFIVRVPVSLLCIHWPQTDMLIVGILL